MLRFLNARCIAEGIESEEDCFKSPLGLAQWVRDARGWAEELINEQPQTYSALLLEAGNPAIERCRLFLEELLGGDNIRKDSIDVTLALLGWANRMRGFEVSWYRAQLWELVVHVVDMALWLGWIYPRATADRENGFASAA